MSLDAGHGLRSLADNCYLIVCMRIIDMHHAFLCSININTCIHAITRSRC